jgi:hypothetical protein
MKLQLIRVLSAVALVACPLAARASPHLLDESLQLDRSPQLGRPTLLLAAADAEKPPAEGAQDRKSAGGEGAGKAAPKPGSLDFDLLGTPTRKQQVDEGELKLRRTMLNWHQGVGLGMFALQLATTVVGQLNYDDKFGGDNTERFRRPHAVLAYTTLAAFVAAGTLALIAPTPLKRDTGFDRVSVHKLSMAVAAAGMLAQGVLGVWTRSREGYLNQQGLATAHLVIGYVTFAAVAAGVGALVL